MNFVYPDGGMSMALVTENPGRPVGEQGIAMLKRMNSSHRQLREFAFSHMSWKDGMRILDEGCGGGAAIARMLELSRDSRIDGIDYQQECIDTAAEVNRQELGRRVNVRIGNILSLPYDQDEFDLVTAIETVYFWPEIVAAFADTRRVLKKGGTFAVINEGSDPQAHRNWPDPDGNLHIYRPEELIAFMNSARFEDIRCVNGPGEFILVTGRA